MVDNEANLSGMLISPSYSTLCILTKNLHYHVRHSEKLQNVNIERYVYRSKVCGKIYLC